MTSDDPNQLLAVIPARAGSKGLPGKNLRLLSGKPLLTWTIEAAQDCPRINRLILSSDDPEAQRLARESGCEVPFTRSFELSTDTASSIDVVFDALERVSGYRYVVLLQPTSPLRRGRHITEAFDLMLDRNAPSCTSVVAVESHPHLMHKVDKSQRLQRFLDAPQSSRRQDLPELFELNGALYIADIEWLMDNRTFVTSETVGYEMTRRESVDIDDVDDLALAEFYLDRSSQAQI